MRDINIDRFVTFAVVDTNGLLRGQKVSGRDAGSALVNGVGMSPAQLALDPTDVFLNLPGVTDESSDFHDSVLWIDPQSRVSMPFERPEDSGLYFAQFTGEAAGLCPRSLLRGIIDRSKSMGFLARIGLELEFTLFNETARTLEAKGFENLETATKHASHDLLIYQAAQHDFYSEVADMCEHLGIELGKMHEEIGGGFMEACIRVGDVQAVCDQAVLFRNFIRVLAMRRNQTVSFMPRWSEDVDSQSSHLHISLGDSKGCAAFWDADADHQMSDTFRYFLGGLQRYLPEVMLLFAPTVNSWRRFAPGTFAPPVFSWGIENRTTCFRVVGEGSSSKRVENRLPCSDANPHLVAGATFAAGLAGIEHKIEPTEMTLGNGYIVGNAQGPALSPDMPSAIAALRQSDFAKDWLGTKFVEGFSATRESQWEQFVGKTLIDERRRFFELG